MKLKTLLISVSAAALLGMASGAAGFEKINSYGEGMFGDVPKDAWYYSEVVSSYELGFMNGVAEKVFSPDGTVTVAEAVTIAARLNAVYNGKTVPNAAAGEKWYDPYVSYAVAEGIISEKDFDNYTRAVTRKEMAVILRNALPDECFAQINTVTSIPDVSAADPLYGKILDLYNSGIVMGSDIYGTFNPDTNIKRSEVSAIINRAAINENRLKKSLAVKRTDDAYLLCANTTYDSAVKGPNSGWRLDNRGGTLRTDYLSSYSVMSDVSDRLGTAMTREFNNISNGILTLDTSVRVYGNGAVLAWKNSEGKYIYKLSLISDAWQLADENGKEIVLKDKAFNGVSGKYDLRIILDLDNLSAATYINGENLGTHPIYGDDVSSFGFETDERGTLILVPGAITITANYAAYEDFTYFGTQPVYGWQTDGNVSVDGGELVLTGNASARKDFSSAFGKSAAETYAYFSQGVGAKLIVGNSSGKAITLDVHDGALYTGENKLYNITPDMWYRLRIENVPAENSAVVKLNGRKIGTVDFAEQSVDYISFVTENQSARFDNLKVFEIKDHDDYVPEPSVKANFDDYIVGVNCCPIWRNGTVYGWSCISPYDEYKPVLGYYDEGNPETADWEIKYMVEHGIDFQAFCWYADKRGGALKSPNNSTHIHDGYMNAKYSDYMKFAIVWETYGGAHFSADQFRKNVVPYWFENYFLDDRYLKIDNKIVFYIYAPQTLADKDYFGSVDGVKTELDYLNAKAKEYGYDGFIFFGNDISSDALVTMGFDASWAYHCGNQGYKPEVNKAQILKSAEVTQMHTVPTISVGLDAWPLKYFDERYTMMSADDFLSMTRWVKNEFLPRYKSEKDTWKSKMVMLSSWNEYGEGTFIAPSGFCGFGYVDAVRESFTSYEKQHTDPVPDTAQANRIQHLYPQYQSILRRFGKLDKGSVDNTSLVEVKTLVPSKDNINLVNISDADFSGGKLTAKSSANDPVINFKDALNLNADEIDVISITIGGVGRTGASGTIYFTTDASPSLDAAKCFTFTPTEDVTTINIETKTNGNFTGTLKQLRIDPFECDPTPAYPITFEKITFYKYPEDTSPKLQINDFTINSPVPAETVNGINLFPFDTEMSVDFLLNLYSKWDKQNKTLTLEGAYHTVVLTVGKSTFTIDGVEQSLGYELYMTDGLPMVDFAKICKAFDYQVRIQGNTTNIITPQYDTAVELQGSEHPLDPGEFNFNGQTTEGWSSSIMAHAATGNSLLGISLTQNNDPVFTYDRLLDMPAKKYMTLEIRCRYSFAKPEGFLQLFFKTSANPNITEGNSLKIDFPSNDSHGEWVTLTYDLTTLTSWRGRVTGFRLDPFNSYGEIEFDYIRFVTNSEYYTNAALSSMFEFYGGDAENLGEGEIPFYSNTAKVSVVEDPGPKKIEGNHVYYVEGRPGRTWAFLLQGTTFTKGKQYHVEFDAKLVSDCVGNTDVKTTICADFLYPDKTAVKNPDHILGARDTHVNEGWVHLSFDFDVSNVDSTTGHEFGIYASPVNDNSVNFMIDNIVVTEA